VKIYEFSNKAVNGRSVWRLAVLLLFLSVLAVISIKNVHGQSPVGKFLRIDFVPGQPDSVASQGRLMLSFSQSVETILTREGALPLFYLDILGATADVNPFLMNFPQGPVKLVRLNQISSEPPVMRATFFMRRNYDAEVRTLGNTIEVLFGEKVATENDQRSSYSLISPVAREPEIAQKSPISGKSDPASDSPQEQPKSEPYNSALGGNEPDLLLSGNSKDLHIRVNDTVASGLLFELARQMKKTVHFRDPLEIRVSLDVAAADLMDAMQKIAAQAGAAVTLEDGDIWVSRRQNPILRISDADTVEGADLSSLALGDVLRALGQIGELNVALDSSLDEIKNRSVDIYLQKTSIRRAFETLLKIHALTVKLIDDKTLMIMTVEKARGLEGKVVRVVRVDVPFDKLKTLLEQAMPAEISSRVAIQEDLGNMILTGDKEAVDVALSIIKSTESKLLTAGEGQVREYFHPLNTKSDELMTMVNEALGESDKVRIAHDKRTDMLLVSGPSSSVGRAMTIIRNLDREPTRQALIHIKLIEILRSDLDEMGLQFPNDLTAAVSDIGNIKASTIVVPATFRGFSENSHVKTLANPTIRCMDREEASIDISEQIPIKNTVTEYLPIASASLAARTSDNWTTSEIGIKLNVTPTIHRDDEISMQVDVDLTELIKLVEGHPHTARRSIKTMVRIKDKETVVIGGLIRKKTDKKRTPVPLLSKIPLLRNLLRRVEHRDNREEQSEMVILITPTLVGSGGIDSAIRYNDNVAGNSRVIPDDRN